MILDEVGALLGNNLCEGGMVPGGGESVYKSSIVLRPSYRLEEDQQVLRHGYFLDERYEYDSIFRGEKKKGTQHKPTPFCWPAG